MSTHGWQHTWKELAAVCHPTLDLDAAPVADDRNTVRAALLNTPWSDECPSMHPDTISRADAEFTDFSMNSSSEEWHELIIESSISDLHHGHDGGVATEQHDQVGPG